MNRFNHRNPLFLITVIFLLHGCARAQIQTAPSQISSILSLEEFPVGEVLEYQISWWGVPVGIVTLSAKPASGASQAELICEGRSNRTLDAFYTVRIKLTSWVDRQTHTPRRFTASIKRRFRAHESVITFDPDKQEAFHELPKGRKASTPVGPQTQDGLSLVYHIRRVPLRVGQTIPLEVAADGKNWQLKGRVVRTGLIRVGKLGSWPAVEGEAELAYPVPFFQGARARVWMSVDEERIPLLAKIHSRIGPVTVVLTRRTPPDHS